MTLTPDRYIHLNSPIHRWQPHYKLVGILCLIFSFACVKHIFCLPILVGITVFIYLISRLPFILWWSNLHYPGWFLVVMVSIIPFTFGDNILWQWEWLSIKQEGCLLALIIITRSVCILSLSLVLFSTTTFLTIVDTLKSLGISPVLADLLLLSYRYLFEIAENVKQMQIALKLRGFSGKNRRQNIKLFAALLASLLIRSYEQSDRVYHAMKLRGYGTKIAPPVLKLQITKDGITLMGIIGFSLLLGLSQI